MRCRSLDEAVEIRDDVAYGLWRQSTRATSTREVDRRGLQRAVAPRADRHEV